MPNNDPTEDFIMPALIYWATVTVSLLAVLLDLTVWRP